MCKALDSSGIANTRAFFRGWNPNVVNLDMFSQRLRVAADEDHPVIRDAMTHMANAMSFFDTANNNKVLEYFYKVVLAYEWMTIRMRLYKAWSEGDDGLEQKLRHSMDEEVKRAEEKLSAEKDKVKAKAGRCANNEKILRKALTTYMISRCGIISEEQKEAKLLLCKNWNAAATSMVLVLQVVSVPSTKHLDLLTRAGWDDGDPNALCTTWSFFDMCTHASRLKRWTLSKDLA